MTDEQMTVKALVAKLKARYEDSANTLDIDEVVREFSEAATKIVNQQKPLLPEMAANKQPSKITMLNQRTSEVVAEARKLIYNLLADCIMDPEFDPDAFISAFIYWYEFQGLAKSYGKKLIYFTPKKKNN